MEKIETLNKLYSVKKKRMIVFAWMASIFVFGWSVNTFNWLTPAQSFFTFIGLLLSLIAYWLYVALSTCPKCNNNFFGGFPRIEKSSCQYCGLKLKDAIKPNK